jgi:hypothetical protein
MGFKDCPNCRKTMSDDGSPCPHCTAHPVQREEVHPDRPGRSSRARGANKAPCARPWSRVFRGVDAVTFAAAVEAKRVEFADKGWAPPELEQDPP